MSVPPVGLLAALALVSPAHASDNGKTGKSTTGCNCHSATADSSTTSTLSASESTAAPGDVVSIEMIVATSSSSRTHAGLDVSTTSGSFTAGSDTKVSSSEITHRAPASMTSGEVTFAFSWTAPSTEGSYDIRGVGQAVDNDGTDGGDAWNLASTISITVDDGCEDADGDGYETCDDGSGDDCDDGDGDIKPGADELCDDVDNDCDGSTDESGAVDATTWYEDADNDGAGSSTVFSVACDAPTGFVADDSDCDDADDQINATATEFCNLVDDDCDGDTDEADAADAATWYRDADGDGYGDAATSTPSCGLPAGYVADATDCDDTATTTNPGGTETCDGEDDDCDGSVDEGATDLHDYYRDADGDGYGVESDTSFDCSPPTGYTALAGDCDDSLDTFHPGATEDCADPTDYNCDGAVAAEDGDGDGWFACEECDDGNADANPDAEETCNGADDDCDGETDEDSAVDASSFYADTDGDGYGDASSSATACDAPDDYVANDTDCDDADANSFPGAPETCDGVDDDCNGTVDDDATDASMFYADSDGDGYGDPLNAALDCTAPTGYGSDGSDCDDADAAVSPAALESCNGADDDCDGQADEADAIDATEWYADADGDGFGDATAGTIACEAPESYVADATDCDDTRDTAHPGGTEEWYDGIDQDCDGNDADQDGDGWLYPTDCDDDDDGVNPDASDRPYDGEDTDCSGGSDYDADDDGFESETYGGTDCDDHDDTTYPGAPEDPEDDVENDCDVRNDHDRDDDGYDGAEWEGDDCDDADPAINPGVDDEWYDGIDSDCDGSNDYDQDRDGVLYPDDCDDTDPGETSTECGDSGEPSVWGDPPIRPAEEEEESPACGCEGGLAGLLLPALLVASSRRRANRSRAT